jgi:hypothetical protein
LIEINLSQNSFQQALPACIASLDKLVSLSLSRNTFTGAIPDLRNLKNLVSLSLYSNRLTGTIPAYFPTISTLKQLYLHDNSFSTVDPGLASAVFDTLTILPNPLTTVPYSLAGQNPLSVMSSFNLSSFLNNTSRFTKRAAVPSASELLQSCPMNDILNVDIKANCLAGLAAFCSGKRDLTQCWKYYSDAMQNSAYANIGTVCPAWKKGPESADCVREISSFKPVQTAYGVIDSYVAQIFVNTVLREPVFAPCWPTLYPGKCFWPPSVYVPPPPAA